MDAPKKYGYVRTYIKRPNDERPVRALYLTDYENRENYVAYMVDPNRIFMMARIIDNEDWSTLAYMLNTYNQDITWLNNGVEVDRPRSIDDIRKDFDSRHPVEKDNRGVRKTNPFDISHVNFKGKTTIVVWSDGTTTKVTAQEGDEFSKEVGIAMCIAKRAYGGTGKFNDIITDAIIKQEEAERRKNEKAKKRGVKKSQKLIEKAKEEGLEVCLDDDVADPFAELSDAWCVMNITRKRNYISYKECSFGLHLKDYFDGFEYDIYDNTTALATRVLLDAKKYDKVREYLRSHFNTPEVM